MLAYLGLALQLFTSPQIRRIRRETVRTTNLVRKKEEKKNIQNTMKRNEPLAGVRAHTIHTTQQQKQRQQQQRAKIRIGNSLVINEHVYISNGTVLTAHAIFCCCCCVLAVVLFVAHILDRIAVAHCLCS